MAREPGDLRRTRDSIAEAYRQACDLELAALKPGNVHRYADGHGMCVADFRRSAEASAGPLTDPALGLGERIFRSVAATRAAVGCNTNLGILLLCAPLIQAALDGDRSGGLRARLSTVLGATDRVDTAWLFRAIRLASPGGLGGSRRHDVGGAPDAPLRTVMAYAASRDRIARAYADGFADLLDHAAPLLGRFIDRWGDERWAATALYLDILSRVPDTHIARKHGRRRAAEVSRRAAPLARALAGSERPEALCEPLRRLDAEFKREGINPGTSADLTVASLLIRRLESMRVQTGTEVVGEDDARSPNRITGSPRLQGHRAIPVGTQLNP